MLLVLLLLLCGAEARKRVAGGVPVTPSTAAAHSLYALESPEHGVEVRRFARAPYSRNARVALNGRGVNSVRHWR